MKRVLTAVVLIPLVLLVVFRAPLWLFALCVAAIIVLALHEYLNIAETAGLKPFKWLTYAVAMLPFVWQWIDGWSGRRTPFSLLFPPRLLDVLTATAVVFGIALVFRKDLRVGLGSVAVSSLGVIYLGGSLALLVCLRSELRILVVFVLFSVWAGDIAAYYVGRSFGKHKLAPIVSPNKSWEGAIASVVASIVVAALVFHYFRQIDDLFAEKNPLRSYWLFPIPKSVELHRFFSVPWIHVFALGIVTNIAAQFGDLFESALKRGANLKDSGSLLPGHGGILDRIDALLFAIPVVWYYAQLTGFLQPKPF
ncbi:MAG TPA: phosphatidate cytidylyltransferase [Candidatus Angelobacter sp.]|nr:phosphatidate cytidylyltransferase [Candidatus Angelobacter sp.]